MTKSSIALLGLFLLPLGTAACGGGDVSCDDVVTHTKELLPEGMGTTSDKDMLARCEGSSQELRKCAMDAKDLAALATCAKKNK